MCDKKIILVTEVTDVIKNIVLFISYRLKNKNIRAFIKKNNEFYEPMDNCVFFIIIIFYLINI